MYSNGGLELRLLIGGTSFVMRSSSRFALYQYATDYCRLISARRLTNSLNVNNEQVFPQEVDGDRISCQRAPNNSERSGIR